MKPRFLSSLQRSLRSRWESFTGVAALRNELGELKVQLSYELEEIDKRHSRGVLRHEDLARVSDLRFKDLEDNVRDLLDEQVTEDSVKDAVSNYFAHEFNPFEDPSFKENLGQHVESEVESQLNDGLPEAVAGVIEDDEDVADAIGDAVKAWLAKRLRV